ncbi:cupin domain-containing protein [Robbsia sp. Bb-Pol-6]|uniref:Cupin domain-containing protein n=1 Tax=Robbsia betulipollinis TaxID=2981849 RepID=A0ABT3ZJK5_9BURK|nr:cupin domain-containing protein [Robbsia betulipollinis]MCY0386706.1 cupin domain-containing protein [Robbsia betulipollinis]
MKTARHLIMGMLLTASASVCLSQTVGVTRTEVLKSDISVPGREAVVSRVTVLPGGKLGWHTHPGDEIAYVESGALKVLVAGNPEREVASGGSFVVPAGAIHGVRNDGNVPVQLVTVHVVRKGEPLATPAVPPTQ